MKLKGAQADYAVPAGGNPSGKETTRDERVQVIALRDKACVTWKVKLHLIWIAIRSYNDWDLRAYIFVFISIHVSLYQFLESGMKRCSPDFFHSPNCNAWQSGRANHNCW